eukprot:scaffold639_cov304-Pinguiococcus_pyrenoidosus.AAC.5
MRSKRCTSRRTDECSGSSGAAMALSAPELFTCDAVGWANSDVPFRAKSLDCHETVLQPSRLMCPYMASRQCCTT